jgi:hypothetical protein
MVDVEMDIKVTGDGKEEGTGFSFGDWVVRRQWGREVRKIKL